MLAALGNSNAALIESLGGKVSHLQWDNYVQTVLIESGKVSQACIIGRNDGSSWACSADFNLKAGEGNALVSLYNNPVNVFSAGVTIAGIKYFGIKYIGIKADQRSIYAKKGASGVVIVRTGQAIIIGLYNENMHAGNAGVAVEKLGDYLLSIGY